MRILQRGDTGNDVRTVQTALTRAGYAPGPVDGVFGGRTERAVERFQRVLGLREDGIVGPRTWAFLEPFSLEADLEILRRGSRGSMVEALQEGLALAGYNVGEQDGLFGTRTQAAVTAFQQAQGLPATGVVDYATWLKLAPFLDYSGVYTRRGDSGVYVAILQTALARAGFYAGPVGGVFGIDLFNAVAAFQDANNLRVDGIAGPRTWAALRPYLGERVALYTVQPGDTLFTIAARFNTTVEELLRLNPRNDPDLLLVGEVLRVPVNS